MDRWWLVDSTDDRLEIVDAENPRIEVAIPADDVEWMVVEDQLVDRVVLLHKEPEVAFLVVRPELAGTPDVALAERGALEKLTELVAIPLRPAHVTTRLEEHELRRSLRRI